MNGQCVSTRAPGIEAELLVLRSHRMWAGRAPPSCDRRTSGGCSLPARRHTRPGGGGGGGRAVFLCSFCPALRRGQTDGVPGLTSCCQGLRGTSSPALVAGILVHSCAAALSGWGAVGALRKAGPSPPHAGARVQGCAFQSRRCLGRAQGRKAGASEGAVTPLGLGWDVPVRP